jgi:hypothetical protein
VQAHATGNLGAPGTVGHQALQRPGEPVHPGAGAHRHRHRLGIAQQPAGLGQGAGRVGHVGLGHRHDSRPHVQGAQHGGMLKSLGHHAVVGGDDHQIGVDAGGPRDHGAHEALVAGHVDHRQVPSRG